MSSDYDGGYAGAFLYTFESEGSKTFTVEASKAGKKKSVQVTAKYEIGAPTLNIDQTDQMVTNKKFELSGKATDDNYSVTVNINGQSAYMNYNGTFSESFTLNEGENKFNVVATNENGKQTTKSVTITYSVGAPTLTLNQNDQSVTSKFFTLTGKATDDNYSVTVNINGQSAYMNYNGTFSESFTLNEGENKFNVVATNENGKQTIKSVTITYSVGAPTLTLNQNDQSVTSKSFTLTGKATDDNYSVTVNINGQSAYMNYNGTFSESFTLNEGENKFNVVATNENGKQTTKSVTITYSVGAPTLTLNQNDQSVTSKFFTLTGKATDDNYSVTVTINGQSAYMNYNGTFSESFTLNEGENKFTVVATNENGKQTTKSITVTLEVGSPIISFINCPETTTQKSISIIGTVGGERNGVYLFVNDKQWSVSSNGKFEQNVSLRNGVNTFDFRAVNSYGKETIVTKIITYSPSNTNDEQ